MRNPDRVASRRDDRACAPAAIVVEPRADRADCCPEYVPPAPTARAGLDLLALTLPVQFGVALPLYRSAWGALRHGTANMEVLVLLGTLAAFFYSFALTLGGMRIISITRPPL